MRPTKLTIALLACAAHLLTGGHATAATQTNIPGPPGSGKFGTSVTVLPNGNIVVTDPYYDATGPVADVGAVHLYNAAGSLISTLTGSAPNDRVGYYGVVPLTNGNYVVLSPFWHNGPVADAGAVSWCSGTTGCNGTVSAANSLVGTTAGDQIGSSLVALTNGHYVARSGTWDNGAATDAGAVTWGNGTSGSAGAVSSANSLVGTTAGDEIGSGSTRILPNGNYVTSSPKWDNGAAADAGAATWCDGTTGCAGAVSTANSLVGTTANDRVGIGTALVLTNGNYVVRSRFWSNGAATSAGAVTWCDGATGRTGAVSTANSLVGTKNDDLVGALGTVLTNGNYVVRSTDWDNGAAVNAGAATWCDGATGRIGEVSTLNSLVGTMTQDRVGSSALTALTNGNYVVNSPTWNGGGANGDGASTWCDGTVGCTGVVSEFNSLVGSTTGDQVGAAATALSDGNYVVQSATWNKGAIVDAGAATWCDGTIGRAGQISASNSLVGSTAGDRVGTSVAVLTDGKYVVSSVLWDNGPVSDVGAATWCNGAAGCTGAITASNSLVGSASQDRIGDYGIVPLTNGNYVVSSAAWGSTDTGAVTWCSGTLGRTGAISASNSLVGSSAADQVGSAIALPDGNYFVRSERWDNAGTVDAGAVTLGRGNTGTAGVIDAGNSVRGTVTNGGPGMAAGYNALTGQLVVGRPSENIVSFFFYRGPDLTVTTIDDHNDGSCSVADCTLREAIMAANAVAGDNVINFAPGVTGTIQLAGPLPALSANLFLQGPGQNLITVRRNTAGGFRIFSISNGTNNGPAVSITGLTIANGQAAGSGGGIQNDHGTVLVQDCKLTGNSGSLSASSYGGAIFNWGGNLTIEDCTLTGNVSNYGGGVASITTGQGTALLVLRNSTLNGNTASGGYGGGVFSESTQAGRSAKVLLSNCTLSGNNSTAIGFLGGTGGAIFNAASFSGNAQLSLDDCTLSGNNAPNTGGLYNNSFSATALITLRNTILKNGASGGNMINSNGTITSLGHNLADDATGDVGNLGTGPGGYLNASGDIRNTDPLLGPLGNNGGSTQTHALLNGSPAINAGENFGLNSADQRAFPRVATNDIGALEFGSVSPAPAVISAVSRKLHGGVPFDINLLQNGNLQVECRSGGISNDYQVIVTFAHAVTYTDASVDSGAGSASSSNGDGTNSITVNLTGVASGQISTIRIGGVSDGVNTGDVQLQLPVLVGDSNGDTNVNSGDAQQTRNRSGQATSAINFRSDFNADGFINSGDATIVRARSGTYIPAVMDRRD